MPVTINGTTGVSGVEGSASTPAIQGGDTNTGIFFPVTDTVGIATGGTERARVDSAGNLGLGVTPSAWSRRAFQIAATAGDAAYLACSSGAMVVSNNVRYNSGDFYINSTNATYYAQQTNGAHVWAIAPSGTAGNAISFTQAMTLDASGNLLVGTTSINSGRFNLLGSTSTDTVAIVQTGSGRTYGNWYFQNKDGTGTGYIQWTGTTTSYVTSSDYRLKENIAPMTGALAKVAALKPCTYKWKADGSDGEGFIAHELQAVVPQCVTGEKDAVDAEGNPVYQGIDTSFLVATLTAAIQELKAIVDQQAIEIANLKGQA